VIAPKTNGVKTALVTSAVKDWIRNGVTNNGVVLLSTGTDDGDAKYDSSEATTVTNRPVLTVTYLVVTSMPPAGCTSAINLAYNDVADTYVKADSANVNFGTATTMLTDPDTVGAPDHLKASLVRFDLSSIPPNANISAAQPRSPWTARLIRMDDVRRALTPWDELSATFNTRNGVNP
jgi:hypothetical protein